MGLLREELIQRRDEGCAIPEDLDRRIGKVRPEAAWDEGIIGPLYRALTALPADAALAAEEPDGFSAIRALRPADRVDDLGWHPSADELLDRLHGAWTGRCCGCACGKPVEVMGMGVEDGRLTGRRSIKAYLQSKGAWPLRTYIPWEDGRGLVCPKSSREHIRYAEPDDDLHYTLIGLAVLEEQGPAFTWKDVADCWTRRLPYSAICTAERQAILNYWNRSSRFPDGANLAADPGFTRLHRNPYREWIGAGIRADGWAWACAGKPERAAEFAWRDAHWTHSRNGIYGEMFFAAAEAAAFVVHDPLELVRIGLGQIPERCRLARAVRECLQWTGSCPGWEEAMDRLEARFPAMSPVHAINNALVCVIALVYGKMDTRLAPTTAVMAGLDTDCNAATVGSITGAAAGRAAFDEAFAAPVGDRLRPDVIGFADLSLGDLARRHAAVWNRIGGG